MARKFVTIRTTRISPGIKFITPLSTEIPEVIHLQDPALGAMLDFQYLKPITISQDKRMYDARMLLEKRPFQHTVFVVDKLDGLVGLLSLEKILTEVPLQVMEEERVKRENVLVKDVMRPITQVVTILYDNLKLAKVGDVVKTFKDENQPYALVLQYDDQDDSHFIRGIFLASLMSKQLGGMDILSNPPKRAKTLAELKRVLSRERV